MFAAFEPKQRAPHLLDASANWIRQLDLTWAATPSEPATCTE